MEELAKSDIFFLLTGIAVVLVTIIILVALYYVIKILKDIEDITDSVKEESAEIIDDIHKVRESVKKGGKKIKNIISPTSKKFTRTKSSGKRKKRNTKK